MSLFLKILLGIVLPLLWNTLLVLFIAQQVRKKSLTPLKFAIVFTLGFGLTVSTILFIALAVTKGIGLFEIGFVLFVFCLNTLIGFPVAYYFSKFILDKFLDRWYSFLSKQNNKTRKILGPESTNNNE